MRMLAQYKHESFKIVTLHSGMWYIHVAIQSTSFSLIGTFIQSADVGNTDHYHVAKKFYDKSF